MVFAGKNHNTSPTSNTLGKRTPPLLPSQLLADSSSVSFKWRSADGNQVADDLLSHEFCARFWSHCFFGEKIFSNGMGVQDGGREPRISVRFMKDFWESQRNLDAKWTNSCSQISQQVATTDIVRKSKLFHKSHDMSDMPNGKPNRIGMYYTRDSRKTAPKRTSPREASWLKRSGKLVSNLLLLMSCKQKVYCATFPSRKNNSRQNSQQKGKASKALKWHSDLRIQLCICSIYVNKNYKETRIHCLVFPRNRVAGWLPHR